MRNAQGVDLVVGAKGSPLQMVLSTIYQADIPTGNISMEDFEAIKSNNQIKQAIPIAIGDNYRGFRLVGTTPDYIHLYGGKLAAGKMGGGEFDAVVGSATNIPIATKFSATHGFSADGNDVHEDETFTVTGVLKPTGTILDTLIITSFQSVQDVHGHHHHEDANHDERAEEEHEHEITAILLKTTSPVAVMNLPRHINREHGLMAVAPSHEIARFMMNISPGRKAIVILGCIFMALSGLMMLSILASGLTERKYDLAVFRVIGAPPSTLIFTVVSEAFIIGLIGSLSGIILGHGIACLVAGFLPALQSLFLPSALLLPIPMDFVFVAAGVACAMAGSIIPCLIVARTDIASLLAQGRA